MRLALCNFSVADANEVPSWAEGPRGCPLSNDDMVQINVVSHH
jgi:hypothetical protein